MPIPSDLPFGAKLPSADWNALLQAVRDLEATEADETFTGSTSSDITLGHTPIATFPFFLYKNGQKLIPGSDYTRAGTAVTLSYARTAADVFEAVYRY